MNHKLPDLNRSASVSVAGITKRLKW